MASQVNSGNFFACGLRKCLLLDSSAPYNTVLLIQSWKHVKSGLASPNQAFYRKACIDMLSRAWLRPLKGRHTAVRERKYPLLAEISPSPPFWLTSRTISQESVTISWKCAEPCQTCRHVISLWSRLVPVGGKNKNIPKDFLLFCCCCIFSVNMKGQKCPIMGKWPQRGWMKKGSLNPETHPTDVSSHEGRGGILVWPWSFSMGLV